MKEVLSTGQLHFSLQIDERLCMGAMFSSEETSRREAVLAKIKEIY
ncbi:MAG: hypothetical protein HYZ48_03940 [Chlamydiales bacterium]|nr:hypothetical protein [Chlamydiales bacterium]